MIHDWFCLINRPQIHTHTGLFWSKSQILFHTYIFQYIFIKSYYKNNHHVFITYKMSTVVFCFLKKKSGSNTHMILNFFFIIYSIHDPNKVQNFFFTDMPIEFYVIYRFLFSLKSIWWRNRQFFLKRLPQSKVLLIVSHVCSLKSFICLPPWDTSFSR